MPEIRAWVGYCQGRVEGKKCGKRLRVRNSKSAEATSASPAIIEIPNPNRIATVTCPCGHENQFSDADLEEVYASLGDQ